MVAEAISEPVASNRPPWCVMILSKESPSPSDAACSSAHETAFVFRMHHSFGDAVSSIAAFLPLFLDIEITNADGQKQLIMSCMSKYSEKEQASYRLLEKAMHPTSGIRYVEGTEGAEHDCNDSRQHALSNMKEFNVRRDLKQTVKPQHNFSSMVNNGNPRSQDDKYQAVEQGNKLFVAKMRKWWNVLSMYATALLAAPYGTAR
jgi:hypothetical protein